MKIYGLFDPVTLELRYIGRTKNSLKYRLKGHLNDFRSNTHKHYWIKSLLFKGLQPTIDLLEEVPDNEWEFWESWYCQYFRGLGCRLTNACDGGGGMPNPSKETRELLSKAHKGRKYPPEFGEAIKQRWRDMSPEERQRRSEISRKNMLGKPKSKEANKKNSEWHKGKPTWNKGKTNVYTPEQLLKMSNSHKGTIPWNKGKTNKKAINE